MINISWEGYWIGIALLLALYYSFVLLRYYNAEIRLLFSYPKQSFLKKFWNKTEVKQDEQSNGPQLSALFEPPLAYPTLERQEANDSPALMQALKDELQAYIEGLSGSEVDTEDLLTSIRAILFKYPRIQHQDNRFTLSEFILLLAQDHCSIHLSADDLGTVGL